MASKITIPDLKRITVTDPLFRHYADMVAEKMIPVQWEILNGTGSSRCFCIDNFRVAAGELNAEHRGVVFGDTDAYKWLEAVAYCANNGQTKYIPMADELIELIGRAQQPDGYLNTYYTVCEPGQRWQNLTEGHELFSAGHLIEAAVAYYEATGKRRLLEIAAKFADLICRVFGPGEEQKHGYPGHQEIELALVKLWRVTGEQHYLDLSRYFIDARGTEPNQLLREMQSPDHHLIFPELLGYDPEYSQSHVPPIRQPWFEVACCPANIARTLASLGQYIYAVDERSLYINLLIGSEIETRLRGTDLHVSMENDLMQGGGLKLRVTSSGEHPIVIRLRVPQWMEQPLFRLDGEQIQPAQENGYAVLAVNCAGTHEFTVHASVPVHTRAANLNVRADVGKVALQKGPFVYCVEQQDNGGNLAALQAGLSGANEKDHRPPAVRSDGFRHGCLRQQCGHHSRRHDPGRHHHHCGHHAGRHDPGRHHR